MKPILFASVLIFSFASCKKDEINTPAHPQMTYTDLSDKVVNITTPAGIDISGDGISDVWFEVWNTNDEVQNRLIDRFTVTPGGRSKLLVNALSATPIIPRGSTLKINANTEYEWQAPAIVEFAKRTLNKNTGTIVWEGAWKDVQHKFLAVQVIEDGLAYNGWIELSFDTAGEKVILYRSAISKEGGKDIVTGK